MNILQRLQFWKQPQQRNADSYLAYLAGLTAPNGKPVLVTNKKSINLGVVFECVDVITRTLSLVSPKIIEQTSNGKYIATNHPLYSIVKSTPYSLYDATRYYNQLVVNLLLFGNAYAKIIRNSNGRITGLKIYEPDKVEPYILSLDGVENHWYKIEGEKDPVNQKDMIHLMDVSFDGVKGISRIQSKRSAIQDSAQILNYSTESYSNGVSISGYLESEKFMAREELDYLRSKFESQATGKNGGIAALPQGFKYHEFKHNLPFSDANIIEAKKFAVEDVARIFGVPLSLIGRGDSADNKADREFNTFLATVIAPLTIIIENEHNRKLFTERERGQYYIKFELKGLYRTDMLTRYQAHQIALNHGFMNKDEVRDVEGLNPIPSNLGKTYYQMLNTIPLDQAEEYYKTMNKTTKPQGNDNQSD